MKIILLCAGKSSRTNLGYPKCLYKFNFTLHKIEKIIDGEGLDEIIDNLILKDRMEKLEENG